MIPKDRYLVTVRYSDLDYDPDVDDLEYDAMEEAVNAAMRLAADPKATVTLEKTTVLGHWEGGKRIE